MPTTPNESAQDLRRRAEELFRAREVLPPDLITPEETKRLLHELQVHQIELEMQNDELRRTQIELDAERARDNAIAIQSALEYSENIVETVREPLLVLCNNLKVLSANSSFYSTFKVEPAETIGRFIYDLGNHQWDIPKLRLLLEDIIPKNSLFNDYEVDHVFQNIGRKTLLLNARQIFRKNVGSHIILLAIEDITERRMAEDLLNARIRLSEYALTHSLDELLTKTLDEAEALTGSSIGFFHFLDESQQTLLPKAWSSNTVSSKCAIKCAAKDRSVEKGGVWADAI